jgi:uncharacterized membrane protein YdjX (TVP38/TMEM64 family)
MVELFLIILLPIFLLPQIAAGYLARQMGRKFWFWFWISFLLPMISLIILMFLEDKSNPKNLS